MECAHAPPQSAWNMLTSTPEITHTAQEITETSSPLLRFGHFVWLPVWPPKFIFQFTLFPLMHLMYPPSFVFAKIK